MTTTNNYVFEFESATDTAKQVNTPTELLESLNLSISKKDPKWDQLESLVIEKLQQGFDYNSARASLALLCQKALCPPEDSARNQEILLGRLGEVTVTEKDLITVIPDYERHYPLRGSNSELKHGVQLHFSDCNREVGWWTVGVGDTHDDAFISATKDGLLFALNPERLHSAKRPAPKNQDSSRKGTSNQGAGKIDLTL